MRIFLFILLLLILSNRINCSELSKNILSDPALYGSITPFCMLLVSVGNCLVSKKYQLSFPTLTAQISGTVISMVFAVKNMIFEWPNCDEVGENGNQSLSKQEICKNRTMLKIKEIAGLLFMHGCFLVIDNAVKNTHEWKNIFTYLSCTQTVPCGILLGAHFL